MVAIEAAFCTEERQAGWEQSKCMSLILEDAIQTYGMHACEPAMSQATHHRQLDVKHDTYVQNESS